ncbi:MAG TPA: TraB/GumN family protein, partial [Flavisolibacter sp.]|nr:TraB/GumN family protein [Flavisolibacter sp.]
MKKTLWLGLFAALGFVANSQTKAPASSSENTLLWRVSGKNITRPSYLFGTMHMICADDIELSDSLTQAIRQADQVFLELDMDNLFEIMSAMSQMKMRNDTTLSDLLTKEEYSTVKNYFSSHSSMLPFAMLETYKPLLAASMLMEMKSSGCDHMISMEQLIMDEAKRNDKKIKGLETMNYQLSIFDSIPYKLQAQQLVKMVSSTDNKDDQEMEVLTEAYRKQQLNKMEELTKNEDM